MGSISANPSIEEVEDELTLTEVLISSLDPDADDFEDQLRNHEKTKAELESVLNSLQAQSRPSSRGSLGMDGAGDRHSGHGGSQTQNGYHGDATPGPSNTGSKRARPQSAYDDGDRMSNKRSTPEPSAFPALDLPARGSSDRLQRHHLNGEARQRERVAQLEHDAALAQQLSQASAASRATPSSSSRPTLQTTINSDGTFRKRPPGISSYFSPSQQNHMQNHPHPPPQMSSNTPSQSIKAEPGLVGSQQRLPQRPRQPAEVVDLTGADSDDEELAEIAPSTYRPNDRAPRTINGYRNTTMRPLHTPTPTTMQRPTSMQIPGAFPGMPPPGSVYGMPPSHTGNGVTARPQSTPAGVYGNPWLTQTMNTIRNGTVALGNQMHELSNLIHGSSSSRPVDLDGDDSDDVIYGGSHRLPGNYAGNEELYRDRFDAFAAYDPAQSRADIEALLANIRPDEEMPAHLRVTTPRDMAVGLHKYQEMGLTWLKQCEEGTNKGGILADDMGLGKTVQMLALMAERKSPDPACKTTLVVAPVALMRQWKTEIHDKMKMNHKMTVFVQHGTSKKKDFSELRKFDVVLTTYGSLGSELKRLENFRLRQRNDPHAIPHSKDKCVLLADNARWYRVILDEAQCIKNRNTQAAKAACSLQARYRYCVTGTPMMNNVEEYFSLIRFLGIKPFSQWEKFRLTISQPLRSKDPDLKGNAMRALQALCKATMLRRTKQSTFEGRPILVLPERITIVDHPVFGEDERKFYTSVETGVQLAFNKYLKAGAVGRQYSQVLVLLLRLRQAACHPHLIKDFSIAATAELDADQMLENARLLAPSVVARIKEAGGVPECPVCYDASENPAIFIPCGHDVCSECFARISDPANAVRNGDENATVRCPECRGAVDRKRLTDFNSFRKVHMPELLTEAEQKELDEADLELDDDDEEDEADSSDTESESDDEDIDDPNLYGLIAPNDHEDYEEQDNEEDHEEGAASSSRQPSSVRKKKNRKSKGKGKGKEVKKPKKKLTLAQLKAHANKNLAAKKKYLNRLRVGWESSAKIDKTLEILKDLINNTDEKILIFSQWTSLLDLLEKPIDESNWNYRRYDGSMSASHRADAVDEFRKQSNGVRIMLISLKAGNAGLNLNMASQVIILDPFWNPFIEEQAIDRAHRLGQTRPVTVHRLLVENTVEDRIIQLQEKKRALISEALDPESQGQVARLDERQLAFLFGMTSDPSQQISYQPRRGR